MERTRQKLHSRRGVSILLALLLMLVAAMVSVVIVGASLTAAKRVNDDRAQEQAALSISSAAKVMVQYLEENNQCIQVTTDTETVRYDKDGNRIEYDGFSKTSEISGLLKAAVEHWNDPDYKNHLIVEAVFDGENMVSRPVILEFTLSVPENTGEPDSNRDVIGTIFLVDRVPADLSDLEELIHQSPQKLFFNNVTMQRFETTDTDTDSENGSDGETTEVTTTVHTTTWIMSDLQLSTMP